MEKCRKCADALTPGVNWSASRVRKPDRICSPCNSAAAAVWNRAHPEARQGTQKAYRKNNLNKLASDNNRRRAVKLAALSPDRDEAKIAAVYALANRLTARFGRPYHVDHIVPLAKGGLHHENNLVAMRGDYNSAKKDKIVPTLISFFAGRSLMSPFHYHGQPVSAADAIAMLKNRKDHARYRLNAKRGRDERDGTILRQLWAMVRGEL
jgi:hypothetical protein